MTPTPKPTCKFTTLNSTCQFAPPNGCFTKIKVGSPPGDTGWGLEISLDIQQAHGLAPAAKVILVEANSNSFDDLLAAVDAARLAGATQISMSWSGGEDPSELGFDSFFNHPGVTFMASTGTTATESAIPRHLLMWLPLVAPRWCWPRLFRFPIH